MTEAQAIQMLQTNPMEFLRKNSITPIAVAGNAPAGLHTFYMYDTLATINRPRNLTGNIRPKTGQRFQIRPDQIFGGFPFHALHIPVQPSNIAINPFPLDMVGTGIMITTQLTGCCIAMLPVGGTWSVAHLQPTGETGTMLQDRLAASGVRVYGANDYSGGRAALIGVRDATSWSFYAQEQDSNYNVISVNLLKE